MVHGSIMARTRVSRGSIGKKANCIPLLQFATHISCCSTHAFILANSDHPTRGCVTPLQIASIKDATEDDLDMLDGYEELPDDLQEKVKQSIENGHVSDEDWRGVRSS